MRINQFIQNNLNPITHDFSTLPKIICADGFSMSVQVGGSLYSTPKKIAKRYSAVEIGFPSEHEILIESYAECRYHDSPLTSKECNHHLSDYTKTIYPYVPVRIVDKVLKKHGGIDLAKTLKKERI